MPNTLAILGGNSVVGRALEVLLQGVGYDVRLIEEPVTGKPEKLLDGVRLLLVAPTLSSESRERFLASMRRIPRTSDIPILMLSPVLGRALAHQTALVLRPCRLEDLNREIKAVLLATSRPEALTSPD